MPKQAVIKWNSEQLSSIKRDLLFFDRFYYDPYLLKLQLKLLENVAHLVNHKTDLLNRIQTTVEYFEAKKLLNSFSLLDFKAGKIKLLSLDKAKIKQIVSEVSAYDKVHDDFIHRYNSVVKLLRVNRTSGFLKYINLLDEFNHFADHHVRLTSCLVQNSIRNVSVTPIIDNAGQINNSRETDVVHLIINNLPIPNEIVPYDEILDFKQSNQRVYLGLIRWINQVIRSDMKLQEIEDELLYYILEFQNALELEKASYRLSTLEVILKLPIEIVEHMIKINWSKIPGSLISIRKNRIDLLKAESKLPGREVAYITLANEKYT